MNASTIDYTLIILAGGLGRRMGGADKGLLDIDGLTLVTRLHQLLSAGRTRVSANRHQDEYRALGFEPVTDLRPGFTGPLAGVEAAIRDHDDKLVVVVPCDMPAVPADLPQRLMGVMDTEDTIAVAHDGERRQVLCMAFSPRHWREDLQDYLDRGGASVHGWLDNKPVAICQFDDPLAFRNINDPETLAALRREMIA